MTWRLVFYTQVENDLEYAKKWYKQQLPGLEKRFSTEVEKALDKIKQDPLLYQIRYRQIRIKHLDVFPFGVHYHLDSDARLIIVTAILHHHQNPDIYYNR